MEKHSLHFLDRAEKSNRLTEVSKILGTGVGKNF